MKPFSESCVQNRTPILDVLRATLPGRSRLLEIGSGTGQHAVYFAPQFPDLLWQTSDLAEMLPGIRDWLDETPAENILAPLELDVRDYDWRGAYYDVIFSANAVHIMAWTAVECFITGAAQSLTRGGLLMLYGPFNYDGRFTSASNARFDEWLKARDPLSGVRDFEAIDRLASAAGLSLKADHDMPANNRTLVWEKTS